MQNLQTQGISLPRLGLGTFRLQGDPCRAAVESALALGYRHIDTAEMYGNEEPIGAAIAASGIARSDLHVTTKVWHENLAPEAIRRAFDTSLNKLKLDHVRPLSGALAVEQHEPAGGVRDADQIEGAGSHPRHRRRQFQPRALEDRRRGHQGSDRLQPDRISRDARSGEGGKYPAAKSIPLVAYCPLAQGRAATDETLIAIGRKHDASAAQVALKWLLDQDGVAAIPKAAAPKASGPISTH